MDSEFVLPINSRLSLSHSPSLYLTCFSLSPFSGLHPSKPCTDHKFDRERHAKTLASKRDLDFHSTCNTAISPQTSHQPSPLTQLAHQRTNMSLFTFGYPTPIPHNPNSHYTQTPTVHTVPTLRHNQSSPLMASPQPIFSMPPTPPITPPSDAFKQPQARQSSARSSRRASPGTLDLNTSSYGLGGNTTSIPQRRRQQNPLQRSTDQRTTAKREEFLEGVRERRSERVFDGRGDRVCSNLFSFLVQCSYCRGYKGLM